MPSGAPTRFAPLSGWQDTRCRRLRVLAFGPMGKKVWRSGVRFDCPDCGKLWRDDLEHADLRLADCQSCGGDLQLVGLGERIVEFAKWYRCQACGELFMRRRGEMVPTKPRSGFAEFA